MASLYPKVKMTLYPKAFFEKVFIKSLFLYEAYVCVIPLKMIIT